VRVPGDTVISNREEHSVAKPVVPYTIGVDVAKDTLEIYHWDSGQRESIANTARSIRAWLRRLPAQSELALEATGGYHEPLLERALQAESVVYLLNAQQLAAYRTATGGRAKTDASDAELLARFVDRERARLRPQRWIALEQRRLRRLLKRRALLVNMRARLQQSREVTPELKGEFSTLIAGVRRMIAKVEQQMRALVRQLGWAQELQLCMSIPGVGPLSAIALLESYRRGAFESIDAFIAFLGLDVRVRDSGRYTGRRKLTKKGDPENRRLLFNAANSAKQCSAPHAAYYARLRARGLSATAATMALGRKLARQAYGVLHSATPYRTPNQAEGGCMAP